MSFKHLMTGLLLCPAFHTLFATSDVITGWVMDENHSPLAFANVVMLATNDSTFINGTVTDDTGQFILYDSEQPHLIRISAIGYDEKLISNPQGELGSIILTPSTLELGEVVVTGTRPATKLNSDGLQVSISGSYLANSGTALDVLGKMPFVKVAESEIEVLGKGAPIVFINGRQVRDQSELAQLASTDIKNVDIITSPGARYDSSVNAVIRITTVAPAGEGFSFNDRTTVGYKHYVYLFEQANFNFRKNGLDLFGMLNYENYRERPRYENNLTQYLPSGVVTQNSCGRDFTVYPVYEGKLGLNYNSGHHSFGLYYDFAYRPSSGTGSSLTSRFLNGVFEDELNYMGDSRKLNRQHTLSAYFTSLFGKWQIAGNLDAMWQINNRDTKESEISLAYPYHAFSTKNSVRNRLLAGNITASTPAWVGELRFGTEVSNIFRRDIYLADIDLISDNDTKIHETTIAVYADISQTFGKLTASAGLRYEYTDSRYYLFGEKKEDQSRTYHNIAPSASLSLPINNVRINLSYTRRTTRPAFEQLSSAVKYLDRYSYESGNPNLKPIYRDYVSVQGAWRDIVVELSYFSTQNYFMWQTIPYPEHSEATLLRMENMPRFSSFEAFANYSPCFIAAWRPTFMAGLLTQNFKLQHNGRKKALNKPLGIFRFNNAIHLPWNIWLNIDLSAETSGNGDNYYMKHRWSCDVGLYKSFAADTWSVKLQLNDLFNTNNREMTSYDALSCVNITKINDTRDLSLTIRYNFNTAKSRYKGSGAANADKGRL